jgi:hypothetical protein
MNNPSAVTFLALFAVVTLLTYLAIRRRWLSTTLSTIIGGAANIIFFVLFSLAQGDPFTRALAVGVFLGLIFTGMTVAIAGYFNGTAARLATRQAADPPQELPPPESA